MKPLKILMFFLLLCQFAIAQTDKDEQNDKAEKPKGPVVVTKIVLDSFHKAYPGIVKATWEYGDGFYEVVFKKDSVDMTVDYDVYGNWQEIETEIKIEQLPQAARDYIVKNYGSFTLTSASKIETDNYDLAYVAQIGKHGKFWDITFDAKGKFLKEEEAD